jgi:hypothetical protein
MTIASNWAAVPSSNRTLRPSTRSSHGFGSIRPSAKKRHVVLAERDPCLEHVIGGRSGTESGGIAAGRDEEGFQLTRHLLGRKGFGGERAKARKANMVGRYPADQLRHHIALPAHGDRDLGTLVREIARDLKRADAAADNDHPGAHERLGPLVSERVDDAARPPEGFEPIHLRDAGILVATRRHDDAGKGAAERFPRRIRSAQDVAACRAARDLVDSGAEPGRSRQIEPLGVGLQILADLLVVGKGRDPVRVIEIAEPGHDAARVRPHVRPDAARRGPVPLAADTEAPIKEDGLEALSLEKPRRDQARRPGADNGQAILAGHPLSSGIPVRKSKSQPRSAASTWSW